MFAGLTKVLSANPKALRLARTTLNFDPALRAGFEAWLEGLRSGPQILLGGRHVIVAPTLIEALDDAENISTLSPPERILHRSTRPSKANSGQPCKGTVYGHLPEC